MNHMQDLGSMLGWTLRADPVAQNLDHSRDLVFERGADGMRRLALARGPEALKQDLAVALTTAQGADLFNLGFGFDGLRAVAEESRPSLLIERVRIAVVQTARQDPRVRRVAEVSAERVAEGPRGALRIRLTLEVGAGALLTLILATPTP